MLVVKYRYECICEVLCTYVRLHIYTCVRVSMHSAYICNGVFYTTYVCMHVCIHVYIYVYIYVCTYVRMHFSTWRVSICTRITFICMYKLVCVYVCRIYVYVYVYMHVSAYVTMYIYIHKKINSVVLVRKRTISTEKPPHVGEVSANFCG
jgi:hypothetical protein